MFNEQLAMLIKIEIQSAMYSGTKLVHAYDRQTIHDFSKCQYFM